MNPLQTSAAADGQRLHPAPACGACRHFLAKPEDLEAQLPGLRALSSAFAAVRARDGLCGLHERYLSAGYSCPDFRLVD